MIELLYWRSDFYVLWPRNCSYAPPLQRRAIIRTGAGRFAALRKQGCDAAEDTEQTETRQNRGMCHDETENSLHDCRSGL